MSGVPARLYLTPAGSRARMRRCRADMLKSWKDVEEMFWNKSTVILIYVSQSQVYICMTLCCHCWSWLADRPLYYKALAFNTILQYASEEFKYHNTVTRCVQFESVRRCVLGVDH